MDVTRHKNAFNNNNINNGSTPNHHFAGDTDSNPQYTNNNYHLHPYHQLNQSHQEPSSTSLMVSNNSQSIQPTNLQQQQQFSTNNLVSMNNDDYNYDAPTTLSRKVDQIHQIPPGGLDNSKIHQQQPLPSTILKHSAARGVTQQQQLVRRFPAPRPDHQSDVAAAIYGTMTPGFEQRPHLRLQNGNLASQPNMLAPSSMARQDYSNASDRLMSQFTHQGAAYKQQVAQEPIYSNSNSNNNIVGMNPRQQQQMSTCRLADTSNNMLRLQPSMSLDLASSRFQQEAAIALNSNQKSPSYLSPTHNNLSSSSSIMINQKASYVEQQPPYTPKNNDPPAAADYQQRNKNVYAIHPVTQDTRVYQVAGDYARQSSQRFVLATNNAHNPNNAALESSPGNSSLADCCMATGDSSTVTPQSAGSPLVVDAKFCNSSSSCSLSQQSKSQRDNNSEQQQQQSPNKTNDDRHKTFEDDESSMLKSYLAHLVLASNIPFAYAIILVAFLITVITATSIITILTIVLTFTGYTAYPLTESPFNTSLALGVVCASFALALVTGSLIVWRRHCQAAYYYLDDPQSCSRGTNSPQLSETYDDSEYGSIPVGEWAKHVARLHADGDIGFSREFEVVQQAKSPLLSSEHSQLPENKYKNRYINIVAYDHTRVTLRTMPNAKQKQGSDYINANFIDGYNKSRAYIGTQGPLVSTFDDYWRMIWEQRVVIIVMITNLQERGRRKCDMYWPKEGTETYGNIQVKLLQEVVMATYTLRTFTAKNLKLKKRSSDSERTVYQYHYTNWPDHGVPDHPLPVLSFVRKSTSANPPSGGPIICHCSAGCGRSGTYIVIDAMLKQIRHRRSINVIDFLKHIRLQRNFLVQTEEQFIFIHDSLVEAIESGETEIASNFIAKYIQLLQTGSACAMPTSASQQQFNNAALAIQSHQQTHKSSNYSLSNALVPNGQVAPPVVVGSNQSLGSANVDTCGVNNPNYHQQGTLTHCMTASKSPSTTATATINGTGNGTNTTMRSQSAAGGQWSLLERQYRLVASFKAKDFNVVSALKPCNKLKNRTLNLIPLEAHRVHITAKPAQEGSDYVNATFLMGFNHLREFIVTQHPVYETFSDFWQMVYDHNSQTIVLLTQMSDLLVKEFPQFWPQKEDEVDYGSFKVKLTQESTILKGDSPIILRDFIMRSNQDDYELQTRVIHCPGWPECCSPLASVFDLIHIVQNATQQQASQQRLHDGHSKSPTVTIGQEHEPQNGGPIIVVDRFGGTEAATFAVLTTLFKQINFEDAVDVYMYAKLAHLRRPGIWTSQDDYLFLYRAIENYASRLAAQQAQQQQLLVAPPLGGEASALAHSLLTAKPTQASLMTMTLDRHSHARKSATSSSHKDRNATLKTSTMRRPSGNKASSSANARSSAPEGAKSTTTLFGPQTPMGKQNNGQLTSNSNTNSILQNNVKQMPNANLVYQANSMAQMQNHQQDQNRAKSPLIMQQQQQHVVTSQLAHPLEQQSHQQQFLQQYQHLQQQQQQQLLFKQQLQQQLSQRQILASQQQQQQQNHYQNQHQQHHSAGDNKLVKKNSNTNNNHISSNTNNNKSDTTNDNPTTLRVK